MFPPLIFYFLLLTCSYAQYDGGDGSAAHPFEIAEPNQLIYMSEHPEDWDKHFILTADLNLNLADPNTFTTALIASDTNNSNKNFDGTPFTGVFDGDNHTIMNLTIDTAGAGNEYLGLFGSTVACTIRNLSLEDLYITSGNESYIIGGLVGDFSGNISYSNTSGRIIAGDIAYYPGGLAGQCGWSMINDCHTSVNIQAGNETHGLGSLIGFSSGSINNSYATGDVSGGTYSTGQGGLVGALLNDDITYCYATGNVTGITGFTDIGFSSEIGGLVGISLFKVLIPNSW